MVRPLLELRVFVQLTYFDLMKGLSLVELALLVELAVFVERVGWALFKLVFLVIILRC